MGVASVEGGGDEEVLVGGTKDDGEDDGEDDGGLVTPVNPPTHLRFCNCLSTSLFVNTFSNIVLLNLSSVVCL